MSDKKTPICWKTSFMVYVYAAILFLLILVQTFIIFSSTSDFLQRYWIVSMLNSNLRLPISNAAWIWCTICSAYVGVDRAAYCIRSANLSQGTIDVGNPKTLRKVICISGLLYCLAIICNILVDAEFDLNAFCTAFGTSVLLYIAGQKAITSVKYVTNTNHKDKEPTDNLQTMAEDLESGDSLSTAVKIIKEVIKEKKDEPIDR